MEQQLGSQVRVRIHDNGSVYEYDATVTEICGQEVRVTLNRTGEVWKVERRKCEIVNAHKLTGE